jgi:hypothetical protein
MAIDGHLGLHLHDKQALAFTTEATELLYGGAAGGGKSHLMRVAAISWAGMIPGLQVYLFRRVQGDLFRNHMEGPKGFRAMLAPWVLGGFVKIVDDEIRFWNGSKIYLCHCKDEKDIYKYQGAEIHVLIVDELTHFTESMYRFLRNRVRMVGVTVPPQLEGLFPRILCGANPGNIGHLWVKGTFIDPAQPMEVYRTPPSQGGMLRQFIPAVLDDNPSMTEDDPLYGQRLEGLGSKALVQSMRYGDWSVVEGAYFDDWDPARHIYRPFTIPSEWGRFMSGDWGSAKPFSFGWWAVVNEPHKTEDGRWLPRGMILRYREWYGCKPGEADVGLKLPAEEVGRRLVGMQTALDEVRVGVLDPAAFSTDGGPTIADRLHQGIRQARGIVSFRKADNKRVPLVGHIGGWDQLRGRLRGDADGNPMVGCLSTCLDSIRTLPALQHDKSLPEDVDTKGEDHAGDEWRYACMSRPWTPPMKELPRQKGDGWAEGRSDDDEDAGDWKTR